ncbi:MAG: hypothetical protein H6579_10440 [Chitinophagales bacterium]|nr:hypothetical protein [Chitinophagales bacterium]
MSVKLVFLIIGIVFWVFRSLTKNNDNAKKAMPATPNRSTKPASNNKPASSAKPKSIDDIFNEFVKEVEKKQQKPAATSMAKKAYEPPKKNLDWQKVEHSKIKSKKQLISHSDYEDISHRIDPSHHNMDIATSEGEVYEFDIDKIDWRDAIISKEILDRKYA